MAAAPIPWSSANTPIDWDVIGINWNTAAKANSISIAAEGDVAMSERVAKIESISMGVDAGQTLVDNATFVDSITMAAEGDATTLAGLSLAASATFGSDLGYTQADDATYRNSISIAADAGILNNVVHPESITLAIEGELFPGEFYQESISMATDYSMSLDSEFLWNDVDDVSTTWTKVEYPN